MAKKQKGNTKKSSAGCSRYIKPIIGLFGICILVSLVISAIEGVRIATDPDYATRVAQTSVARKEATSHARQIAAVTKEAKNVERTAAAVAKATTKAQPTLTSTPKPTATPQQPTNAPLQSTNTPLPLAASTPEAIVPMVTVSDSNVNIRRGPSTEYDIVGTLQRGQSFEIVGRNADFSWWQVSTPNGLGWVAASVTEASNADDSIPVVETPAVAANASIADPGSIETVPTASIAVGTCPNPDAQIIQPEPGSKFSSLLVPIIGTANIPNFSHYKMEYSTDPNNDNWSYLLQRDSAVENDVLMELNTSTIPYGPYGLRLTVVDLSSNYPEPCVVWFENASVSIIPTKAPIPTATLVPQTPGHPSGATAICRDGTYSYSANRRGTCSHHGGVSQWLR